MLIYRFFNPSIVIHHSFGCCLDHQTNLNIGVTLLIPFVHVSLQVFVREKVWRREPSLFEEPARSSILLELQVKVIWG